MLEAVSNFSSKDIYCHGHRLWLNPGYTVNYTLMVVTDCPGALIT